MIYRKFGKRLVDLVLVIPALVVLSPVLGAVALLVRIKLGQPILFRQLRPGLNGNPFTIYKFRTMTDACDAAGNLLPDSSRLIPFGRFLRSTSLDELPELFNIVKGDMSLVGPRPLLMRYTPYFTEKEQIRFQVRPGITGLAQISGRNDLVWDARIAADVSYVRQYSLALDLSILFKTVGRVVTRQGLQSDPGAAMLDFDVERRLRLDHNRQDRGSDIGSQ
jgi:lipopolysaccharide/colanic/teichoic acid biosynthesis glycosyltransferase